LAREALPAFAGWPLAGVRAAERLRLCARGVRRVLSTTQARTQKAGFPFTAQSPHSPWPGSTSTENEATAPVGR